MSFIRKKDKIVIRIPGLLKLLRTNASQRKTIERAIVMGMLDICSNSSYWRGLDYFERGKVKILNKTNDNEYDAIVSGTEDYNVHIDLCHPKKSTCTCPHAKGKSTICKHKVAVYFAVFPEAVEEAKHLEEEYYREQEEREQRIEEEMQERRMSIKKYVDSLSAKEARKILYNILVNEEYERIEQEIGHYY